VAIKKFGHLLAYAAIGVGAFFYGEQNTPKGDAGNRH
jgi:hypothetical protein